MSINPLAIQFVGRGKLHRNVPTTIGAMRIDRNE